MEVLSIRPLSAELTEKAKLELNESPKNIVDGLKELRSWLSKQPHINARNDDQFLIVFLRVCKYSLERAKEKIDLFYTIRTAMPEFTQLRITPQLQDILNLGLIVPLPKVDDKTGARIVLLKSFAYDPCKVALTDIIKTGGMVFTMQLMDDDISVVCGHVVIMDLQGLTFGHISQLTPSILKKLSSMVEAECVRQKSFHLINSQPLFETTFKFFHALAKSKMKERIFLHDSLEALYKHINKNLLPIEYGGTAGSVQDAVADLKDKLMQRREWFIEDEKYKTDESKRQGTPKTADTIFGTAGSFRTLEFD